MNQYTQQTRAWQAAVAGGIHASSIAPHAAYTLLEANKAAQRATGKPLGAWCHQGEYVPVWTGSMRHERDRERFDTWCKGHRAHGAKHIRFEPVNGCTLNDVPDNVIVGVEALYMRPGPGSRIVRGVFRLV